MDNIIKKILKEEFGVSLPIKVSGSYSVPKDIKSRGDALHAFNRRKSDKFGGHMLTNGPIPSQWSPYIKLDQGKSINQVLDSLEKKGIKADVTDLDIKVNNDFTVEWEATIDKSKDDKSYRVFTRGSAGNSADTRAQRQLSGLKSDNSEFCGWDEVLDLNITKPFKIRQFFLRAAKCKEGEVDDSTDDKIQTKDNETASKYKSFKDIMASDSFKELQKKLQVQESKDRRNIIKKVLTEETNLQSKLLELTSKLGWEKASLAVGGTKKLAEIAFDGNPYEFLDRFNNLRIERDEESDDISFLDRNGKRLIYIDGSVKTVYFDHDEIWKFIEKGFENYILYPNQILYQWFKKTYGIGQFGVMYAHWLNYRR
jgi:hypothetical protein